MLPVLCPDLPLSALPTCSKAFQPLVDAGYVEVVFGGGPVGKYLCNHPDIASGEEGGVAAGSCCGIGKLPAKEVNPAWHLRCTCNLDIRLVTPSSPLTHPLVQCT